MFLNGPIAHSVNLDAVMPTSYGKNYVRLDALVRIFIARLHTSDQRSYAACYILSVAQCRLLHLTLYSKRNF